MAAWASSDCRWAKAATPLWRCCAAVSAPEKGPARRGSSCSLQQCRLQKPAQQRAQRSHHSVPKQLLAWSSPRSIHSHAQQLQVPVPSAHTPNAKAQSSTDSEQGACLARLNPNCVRRSAGAAPQRTTLTCVCVCVCVCRSPGAGGWWQTLLSQSSSATSSYVPRRATSWTGPKGQHRLATGSQSRPNSPPQRLPNSANGRAGAVGLS